LLKTNIRLNRLRNLLCLETAISTFNGSQKIYLSITSNHHSMYPTISQNCMMVPVKTVDTVLKENKIEKIDYLRMDIEGYEVELIDSMPRALKSTPKLFIELHLDVVGLTRAKEFLLKLRDAGYELQYVVDRDKDFPYYEGNDAVKQGITITELIEMLSIYRVCCVFLGKKE
jgi:FkbM family methyltransferase